MDGKSSCNQEIRPIADFKDRAVPLGETTLQSRESPATRSANQVIHPVADFSSPAHAIADDAVVPSAPEGNVEITIDSDLIPFFPTAQAVNDALRALVNIARRNGTSKAAQ